MARSGVHFPRLLRKTAEFCRRSEPRPHAPRRKTGDVAKVANRVVDPRPGVLVDIALAADRIRNGARRNARGAGDSDHCHPRARLAFEGIRFQSAGFCSV